MALPSNLWFIEKNLSAYSWMSSSNPSPQGSGFSERIGRWQCLPDIIELIYIWIHGNCGNTLMACIGSSQMGYKHWEEKWRQSPTPNPGKLFSNWKISFLQWSIIGYIIHTPGQASCSGEVGQYETHIVNYLLNRKNWFGE